MDNPFDVFDNETPSATPAVQSAGVNPFDQFDGEAVQTSSPALNFLSEKGTGLNGQEVPKMRRSEYTKAVKDGLLSNVRGAENFQEIETVDDDYVEGLDLPENAALKKVLTPKNKREGEFAPKRKINEALDTVLSERLTPSPVADFAIDVAAGLGQAAVNPIDTTVGVVKSVAGIPKNAFNAVRNQNEANAALEAIPEGANLEELQAGIKSYDESRSKAVGDLVNTGVGGLNAFTLGRGGKAASQALKGGGVKSAAAKVKPTQTQKDARRAIYAQAKRAGKTPAEVDAAIAKAKANGDATTFWQALDLDDAAEAISVKGGAPAKIIETQVKKEIAEQGPKVRDLFATALSNPKVTLSPQRVEAAYKKAANKEYKEAYKVDFRPSKEMSDLLSDMRMQDRLATAEKSVMKSGSAGKVSQTEILHQVKKDLDDDISALFRDGRGNRAVALKENYLNPLIKELGKANPKYDKARINYGDGSSRKRATELGEKVFKVDEDDFADAIKGMSKADRASLENGIMRAVRKKMDKPDRNNSIPRMSEFPSFRRKLEKLMPERDVEKLIKGLDDEGERFARNSNVNAKFNSATGRRADGVKRLDEDLRGPIRKVGAGAASAAVETRKSVVGALSKVFGKGSEGVIRRMDDKTTRTMADIMAKPIKDAPDIFKAMPANRRKKFVKAMGQLSANPKGAAKGAVKTALEQKTLAKKLAVLTAIEQIDNSLKKEIDAARRAMNDNFEEPTTQAVAASR